MCLPGLPIMHAFLSRGDFNFFMVDWSLGAETLNYILARGRVNEGIFYYDPETVAKTRVLFFTVGTVVAQFADFLGQNTNLISVMGHSLGAHAAVSVFTNKDYELLTNVANKRVLLVNGQQVD